MAGEKKAWFLECSGLTELFEQGTRMVVKKRCQDQRTPDRCCHESHAGSRGISSPLLPASKHLSPHPG